MRNQGGLARLGLAVQNVRGLFSGAGAHALLHPRHRVLHLSLLFGLVVLLNGILPLTGTPAFAADVIYSYDELGRLKSVTNPAGETAEYVYDAVGNIVQIRRTAAGSPTIVEFFPNSGPVGTAVSIFGSGFGATPAQNTVKFNDVAATVATASPTALTAAVPAGATTGRITVTTAAGTATSGADFVVADSLGAPTISGFTPSSGSVGTVVTVSGTNFDPAPGATKVEINQSLAPINTITAASIAAVIPGDSSSGRIRVTTPKGITTSAADLIIPPANIAAADIVSIKRISIGGPAQTLDITPQNKAGLFLFDGTLGSALTLELTALSINPSNMSVAWELYTPRGVQLDAWGVTTGARWILFPPLPYSGTYSLYFKPGSATASLTAILGTPEFAISAVSTGAVSVSQSGVYSFPITFTVTNQGTVSAKPSWFDVAYLSADGIPDASDAPLNGAAWNSTSLAPGANYTKTMTASTSATQPAGSYTLFVKADGSTTSGVGTGALAEPNEANNLFSQAFTLPTRPDLAVSGLTVGAFTVNQNGSYTFPVSFTVTNVGGSTAKATWYDYGYLSGDGTLDTGDAYFASGPHSTDLSPGASYAVNSTYTTATTVQPGPYTLFVKADGGASGSTYAATDNLVEESEANNVASQAITLPAKPDLAASGVTIGAITVNQNGSYSFPASFTVTNVGASAARATWYDYGYLSGNGVLDGADPNLGYTTRSVDLAAGANYVASRTYTTGSTVAPGTYTFFGKADGNPDGTAAGALAEPNEANNAVATSITLPGKPDLAASGLTVGAITVNQNGSYSFPASFTVTNVGASTAKATWYDYGYLSTDGVLDAADPNVGYTTRGTDLTAGANYVPSRTYTTASTVAPGTYTFFGKADGNPDGTTAGALAEPGEANNVVSTSITLPGKPDLAVSGLTVGTITVNANGSYSIPASFTVTNTGVSAAKATWYDYGYLSADGTLDAADPNVGYSTRGTDLAAGANYVVNKTYITATTAAPGSYTLFVKADGQANGATAGALAEADESNNAVSLAITLPPKP